MKLKPGTFIHRVIHPFTVVLRWLTFGRVDFTACAGCARRAAELDRILGNP